MPLPILLGCGCIVRLEGAHPLPPPSCPKVGWRFCPAFLVSILLQLQLAGNVQQRAEQGGAVIVQQLDQPGFLHEAAQLDELAGACAPFLHPVAGVVTGAGEGGPILLHGQAPELRRCGLQVPEQGRRLLSSPACPLAERRRARVRSTSRRLRAASWIARRRRAARRQGLPWAGYLRRGPEPTHQAGRFSAT